MQQQTIYLVRHGQTDYNLKGIVQGSGVDASLNDTGRAQAWAFYEQYCEVPFELVVTSALQRTRQTLSPFIEEIGLPWEQTADINEICWGVHEGRPGTPEMKAEYREMKDGWKRGDYHLKVEGGESALDLQQRLDRFLAWLRGRTESHILICSHGRAMCGLVAMMKGEPLSCMENYMHSNTGLWVARRQEAYYRFELENDTRHLSLTTRMIR